MESVESYWAKIPLIVREFVPKYIKSATALEILLILQSTPEEEWQLSEISGALELDLTAVADRMEELKSAGLVRDRSLAYEHFYQYAPATHEIQLAIDGVAKAYSMHPVKTIRLIVSDPLKGTGEKFER
jgi:DNA-binding Lrp family transcriptional regulator